MNSLYCYQELFFFSLQPCFINSLISSQVSMKSWQTREPEVNHLTTRSQKNWLSISMDRAGFASTTVRDRMIKKQRSMGGVDGGTDDDANASPLLHVDGNPVISYSNIQYYLNKCKE